MKHSKVPSKTKAILIRDYAQGGVLYVGEKGLKKPGPDEVVIKMEAAPINPSDLLFIEGKYGIQDLPWIPGFEGSGTVVYASKKWKTLENQRVACRFSASRDGTWAEYLVTSGSRCYPIPAHADFFQGAAMLVNPLTAWGLLQKAKKEGHRAAIQTAGLSNVSRMTLKLSKRLNYPLIFIVRKSEQVDILKKLGAKYVLNSSQENFKDEVTSIAHKLKATVAFDAIGGEFTDLLLSSMPENSEVWSYGKLRDQPCVADPMNLAYGNKSLKGFWVTQWQSTLSKNEMSKILKDIAKYLDSDFKTDTSIRVSPKDIQSAITSYRQKMSAGKPFIDLSRW